jgi:ferritin-like protein
LCILFPNAPAWLASRRREPLSPKEHDTPMSSEGLHVPREKLSKTTLNMHYAIASLIEELEAVDWYRQRADDCDDPELKKILLHNAREEIEHASMALEWIRRNDGEFDAQLKEFLFSEGSITEHEEESAEDHGL